MAATDLPPRTTLPLRTTWAASRAARLAFLLGRGCSAEEIAADPGVCATSGAVRRQALRLGLAFRAASGFRLPHAVYGRYAAAAARRGITADHLIHLVLVNAGSDDALISNILDDDA